jgi:formylglycine-generating enzyme required for sulfatase activity
MIAGLLLAALASAQSARTGDGPPGLVLVPGGRTKIGTEESEVEHMISDPDVRPYAGALSAETPRREVDVPSFWLMTTEVTNEQYAAYVRATGSRPPEPWGEARIAQGRERHLAEEASRREEAIAQGKPAPEPVPFDSHAWWLAHWNAKNGDPAGGGPPWEIPKGDETRPVVFVDWEDARAYARWAGLRLMTELEYERAVRGDTARTYAWGNDWEDGKYAATSLSDKRTGAYAVGSFPAGASRQGVFDLAGNVWEWTASPYLPFPGYQTRVYDVGFGAARKKVNAIADWNGEQRVVVGGSFQNGKLMARATTRRAADRGQAADALGFRCAASTRPGLDLAAALLESALPLNARPRDARGTIEFAAESVVCADGWSTATPAKAGSGPEGYAVVADYRFVVFAPVRLVPTYDPSGLDKLSAAEDLVALGFLSTNVPVTEPELPAGTYTLFWRGKGARPTVASASVRTEEAPLAEALHLDVDVDQLIVADASGRPVTAWPCKLEWENLRECRVAWIDPATAPRTGGDPWPEGTRILRLDLCAPCRAAQKGFAFGMTLRFAPDALTVSWRPR